VDKEVEERGGGWGGRGRGGRREGKGLTFVLRNTTP